MKTPLFFGFMSLAFLIAILYLAFNNRNNKIIKYIVIVLGIIMVLFLLIGINNTCGIIK
jgi:hypothetical protein